MENPAKLTARAAVCWLLLAAAPVGAAADPGAGMDSALGAQLQDLALQGAHAGAPAAARVEVVLGALDPRLRLAPCLRIEPYLPDEARMWGKTRLGVRCVQGAVKWNVSLPVTVKVYARASVALQPLAAGSVLAAADLAQAEVDLAEDPSAAIVDPALAVGRTLARALRPGQSVRQSHLKPRQWFAAGETVTVQAQGEGFSVASEAQALNNGIEGQPVRVRTESGRVLTGMPVGERRVDLAL